jgi:anti-anti-sigma factor
VRQEPTRRRISKGAAASGEPPSQKERGHSGEATSVAAGRSDSTIVVHRPSAHIAVVELHGEHDLTTSEQITAAIAEELRARRGVVVDVSNASFIDASVLHAIADGHAGAQQAGLGFALQYGTSRLVRRIFEITGFLASLPSATSREQALELAQNPA